MIKNFKSWIKCAGIRALKTFAQTFLATIGSGAALLGDVNWVVVLSTSTFAGILSLATSLTGLPEVKTEEEAMVEPVTSEELEKVKEDINNEPVKES